MEWISVKDRLPECDGGDFFCYDLKENEYYVARFSERMVDESHWHDSGFSVFPSHWMIPEPPKP